MRPTTPGYRTDVLALKRAFATPYTAVIRSDVVLGVPRYFMERWLPVLGPAPATLVTTLRQIDYGNEEDAVTITGAALAAQAAMSRRHLYRCFATPWMPAFVETLSSQPARNEDGTITQQTNRYRVQMDDPLNPADAEHLVTVLSRLADEPLAAAEAARRLNPRELWAGDPKTEPQTFTRPRPLTARDAMLRAFPTWEAENDAQRAAFNAAAQELHRHVTLVREDGRTSKIIVAGYFHRRWWKRLGHDLAWSYLWLRGCVYANDEERRDTCWLPALNTLLDVIGRPREWWRRNVENATPHPEGWSVNDFFTQIAQQKGRDPKNPQRVARQFRVALDLPIAPDDREYYEFVLGAWNGTSLEAQPLAQPEAEPESETPPDDPPPANGAGEAGPPQADTPAEPGSATNGHTGKQEVCHIPAHPPAEPPPQPDTPAEPGSATDGHTGDEGVRHTPSQGSATPAHSDSDSPKASNSIQASSPTSKHQTPPAAKPESAPTPLPAAAGEGSLIDQLSDEFQRDAQTPLYRAASVTAWLRDGWTQPVLPHTPAWIAATTGEIDAQDLVALMLAVSADASVRTPPRYLSWLFKRWEGSPDSDPVSGWAAWREMAALPLETWLHEGQDRWTAQADLERHTLPFGLDALVSEFRAGQLGNPPEQPPVMPAASPALPLMRMSPLPPPEPEPDPSLQTCLPGMNSSISGIWMLALGDMRLRMGDVLFNEWLRDTEAVRYADGVLYVRPRSATAQAWIERNAHKRLLRVVKNFAQMPIDVQYVTDHVQ